MRAPIQDEFTLLPLSRQRKYQLRCQRDRRCTECGQPVAGGTRCLAHLVKARERQRSMKGLKRRYHGTLSYRLEAALSSATGAAAFGGEPRRGQTPMAEGGLASSPHAHLIGSAV